MLSTVLKYLALVSLLAMQVLAQAANFPDGASVIAKLYKDFAWQAVFSENQFISLIDQPKSVLDQYFAPALSALILQDRLCVKRTREICGLDFDPLFASQDPAATDLRIGPVNAAKTVVQFKYPSTNNVVKLEFMLVQTAGQWRIADIVYKNMNDASLRAILTPNK